jgi:hypothetical protein
MQSELLGWSYNHAYSIYPTKFISDGRVHFEIRCEKERPKQDMDLVVVLSSSANFFSAERKRHPDLV